MSPSTVTASVASELSPEALEAEITTLAAHLNAGTFRFLTLIADFDTRQDWAVGAFLLALIGGGPERFAGLDPEQQEALERLEVAMARQAEACDGTGELAGDRE